MNKNIKVPFFEKPISITSIIVIFAFILLAVYVPYTLFTKYRALAQVRDDRLASYKELRIKNFYTEVEPAISIDGIESLGKIDKINGNGDFMFIDILFEPKGDARSFVVTARYDCPLDLELGTDENTFNQKIKYFNKKWYVANSSKLYSSKEKVVKHIIDCMTYAKNKNAETLKLKKSNQKSWDK